MRVATVAMLFGDFLQRREQVRTRGRMARGSAVAGPDEGKPHRQGIRRRHSG